MAALSLVACGGGSGGGSNPPAADAPRQPQPTEVRDENPTAARMDVGPADFLPSNGNARWVFERQDRSGARLGSTTLEVTIAAGGQVQLTEADDGVVAVNERLNIGAIGWTLPELRQPALPAGAVAIVGRLLKFPTPFHGIGTTRVQTRSGNYGADIDGDGVNESFEFQFRQTMIGYEAVAGPRVPIEALRIREERRLTVIPSRRSGSNQTSTATRDTWYARGIGPVREESSSVGPDGVDVFAPHVLSLRSATINGADPLGTQVIREAQALEIFHRDLVFDAGRNRYYASVGGGLEAQGNRIAVIDAATGAVEYSRVVASEPGVMAIAADGASLYVSAEGSSELLRLALPSFAEMARAPLPVGGTSGALQIEAIAASPLEPGVVALALTRRASFPGHRGVYLVRDMQLQARPTPWGFGSPSNRLVFGADGRWLHGLNIETSEFGLRRIEVLADGLINREVQPYVLDYFYVQSLDLTARGLLAGNRLFAADTLAMQGLVSGGIECRAAAAGQRLICLAEGFDEVNLTLLVADAETATVQTALRSGGGSTARRLLVPGPTGQVAVRDGVRVLTRPDAARILLLRHPALP